MKDEYIKLLKILGERRILHNEPLFKYSSLHIGGPADLFYKAQSKEELIKAISSAKDIKIPYFVIGGGTNLLISDLGFRGIVIKNETKNIKLVGIKGEKKGRETRLQTVFLEAESGVGVNRLVRFTLDQGLSGLESFLGQPGTVGGAIFMNAHNMKMKKYFGDAIFSSEIFTMDREIKKVSRSYFKFGYDKSIIQKTGEIVLSVILDLQVSDKKLLWLKAQNTYNYRQKTHPQGVFSSGCTFRNIEKSQAVRLATPSYTCSAGFLLERVGLKGKIIGKARFSDRHANFIIHNGGVKASEVVELIKLAKSKVKEKFGINLMEEIVKIGDFNNG